jgi:nicotinamide-nucleotide amidase
MEEIVNALRKKNKTISTMESCTGGYIVNSITNIPGASYVLKYSCVTYSNEYKIKMGVDKKVIDKYTVYSQEVADEMSKRIAIFSDSNYGIGITGKLLRKDQNNDNGLDNEVFISIYDKDSNRYIKSRIKVIFDNREDNKKIVCDEVIKLLKIDLEIR